MKKKRERHPWRVVGIIAGVLIVLIFIGWLYTQIATPCVEHSLPPEGNFITVNDVQLHVVREGSGLPVVLLPCGDCTMSYFTQTPLFPLLTAAYDTLVFDRYGLGYSDISSDAYTTPTEQAALIHDALDVMDVGPVVVVGSSSGGSVALAYALNYPEDTAGLVLVGGWAYADEDPGLLSRVASVPVVGDVFIEALLTPLGHGYLALSKDLTSPDPTPSPEFVDSLKLILRPDQFRAALAQETGFNDELPSLSLRYGELVMPVISVTGSQDEWSFSQVAGLEQDIPQLQVVVVEGAGHFPYFGHPEVVLEAVEAAWTEAAK